MKYEIKPLRGSEDRMYAYGEDQFTPVGSFKDTPVGTIYTSRKSPRGHFIIDGMKSGTHKDYPNLLKFIGLIEGQKIPNVVFNVKFTTDNLTEEGFSEFLKILFPKRKDGGKKSRNRRYYLHGRIAGYCNLDAANNIISVPDLELTDIPEKIVKAMMELKNRFRYSIQQEIPN